MDQRGLQFRVELAGHKVGVVREFHNLHNVFVGSFSGENELLLICSGRIALFNLFDILRVHFVAVAEAFADGGRTVNLGSKAIFLDDHVVTTEAHRRTQILDVFLAGEECNDRNFDVVRFAFHFDRTCTLHTADVACKFHDGELHAIADAEERDLVFAHVADDLNFAFDTAATETTRNDDCVDSFEIPLRAVSTETVPFSIFSVSTQRMLACKSKWAEACVIASTTDA